MRARDVVWFLGYSRPERRATAAGARVAVGRRGPVVGRRLRGFLYLLLALFALLAANSVYLSSITALEWASRRWGAGLTYQNHFYLLMFLAHLVMGLLLFVPFVSFGIGHFWAARGHKNWHAVRFGYGLLAVGSLILLTGLLLVRIEGFFEIKNPAVRSVLYWGHVFCPVLAVWLYWLHRVAGRSIRWKVGIGFAVGLAATVLLLVVWQQRDPRNWQQAAAAGANESFGPSLARTQRGNLIPATAMMMDQYCQQCHADAHRQWRGSMHHLSSFNNPAYRATVLDLRAALLKRDGNTKALRWCAGCHDPVPLLAGMFDSPNLEFADQDAGQAGVTCTVCHAITHVNSVRGNADYTIDAPIHYPFANSTNPVLQFINRTLIKAKPSYHKQVFLKPVHKTAEFCAACHKVHLPWPVTHYKEFLRGQNHYDNFLLSGVSGHGARSFYYPDTAQQNCNGCHMPLTESHDFGAQDFDKSGKLSVHSHFFPGANTAVPWLHGLDDAVRENQRFLEDNLRVDIFGIREAGTIDGKLHAPLRPTVPALRPGRDYLIEIVIRTLKVGHLFTQGTTDSNEVWLRVQAVHDGQMIGQSGGRNADGAVDPEAHFVNVFMLDRTGHRINRRNAQDIFVPLYNHQIPPGAGQTVHYRLHVPESATGTVQISVQLNYRKFDTEYMQFIDRTLTASPMPRLALRGVHAGGFYRNDLPVTVLARDQLEFPLAGSAEVRASAESPIPAWQRWNDYGIGLLLKGKAELRQAAAAFAKVEELGRYDGPLNLARVAYREGRLDAATAALQRAANATDPPAPAWTLAWLSGLVNREQGHMATAEQDFREVLQMRTAETQRRGFDFSRDYMVINELGLTQFFRAQQVAGGDLAARRALLQSAINSFQRTLKLDPENVAAHYNLAILYRQIGDPKQAATHATLHQRYRVDDNARDKAVALARKRYPAADRASQGVAIYRLRNGGPYDAGERVSPRRGESEDSR